MELIKNQKAKYDFEVLETFEAGIELRGYEVKALKSKMGSLKGARAMIKRGEIFLIGMVVPPYQKGNVPKDYDPVRERKLFLHKREIVYLAGGRQAMPAGRQGLTIIPLRVYTEKNRIKIEIALCRSLKKYDKRRKMKERDERREVLRVLKAG